MSLLENRFKITDCNYDYQGKSKVYLQFLMFRMILNKVWTSDVFPFFVSHFCIRIPLGFSYVMLTFFYLKDISNIYQIYDKDNSLLSLI